jgi:hypothetical protein
MSTVTDKLIEKSTEAGQLAKLKLYNNFSRRIADGDKLGPTELKLFNQLDRYFTGGHGAEDEGPPDIFDTFDDAVTYLGVSKRTLSVHIKKGTLRQEPDGTFLKSELDKYLESYGRKTKENGEQDPIEIQIKKADLRWREARAIREEMLTEQIRGTLINRDEVNDEWASALSTVRHGLDIFSDRLPPLLKNKSQIQMYEIISQEVWELLDALYTAGKYTTPPPELLKSLGEKPKTTEPKTKPKTKPKKRKAKQK